MTNPKFQWSLPPQELPPKAWIEDVSHMLETFRQEGRLVQWSGQLLWQRGWRDPSELQGFLNPVDYAASSPFAFGAEMNWAIARLITAYEKGEKVAIWGDFDADGLTATAVLWEGLGQFFPQDQQLRYYVPNRFTESHGLSQAGIDNLAQWGCSLMVTCDTGSTADAELAYAETLDIEVIVTDHHTLPETRPPVVALINPRQLPTGHPLAHLSGVAVAYKLMEALYDRLPTVPQQPLETLLDLVAIGLIADLVTLQGDCRYLTQIGLKKLEQQAKLGVRPGVTKLLEFCKRTGDRPSDVAFGIGPRINAVSRIHGDAHFGVQLLTSRDRAQAEALALDAELANTRRKDLQATVMRQASLELSAFDLSTTQVIILSDPQWSPGVLGLVASQLAQQYGRPTILFQTEITPDAGKPLMARGSARSVNNIDLYRLVKAQSHLLTSFGGHPYAAGLTLPVTNLPLFTEGINRALRSQLPTADLTQPPLLHIDLEVTVAELGKDLFKSLKLLEPYGMGNPVPCLLLRQIQIENVWEDALKDKRGGKQRYYKLSFEIKDPATQATFPGHWWGHRRHELPAGSYDIVVELDVNTFKKRYEARLIDIRLASASGKSMILSPKNWIVDQRDAPTSTAPPPVMATCPTDWSDFAPHRHTDTPLTLAYPPPVQIPPETMWQQWVGIAKYLARTGELASLLKIREKLAMSDRTLQVGCQCLEQLGFITQINEDILSVTQQPQSLSPDLYEQAAQTFLAAMREEQFRQGYFYDVSPGILQQVLGTVNHFSDTAD
ncbi:MAG: single-stranded-DNA-specific exonuclease RecJ [Leptolyngbya sp. SIO1D8]|nr:single-stranded-DNA-specific exonuclease RecJ [Leptolyngbya sp. SIO1D8]